jgi:hypothetical protein
MTDTGEWKPPERTCGDCALATDWKAGPGKSTFGRWGTCSWVRENLPVCLHPILRDIRESTDATACPHFQRGN